MLSTKWGGWHLSTISLTGLVYNSTCVCMYLNIKPHVAHGARVVLDAGVPDEVYLEVAGLRELLAALRAAVVLLVVVRLEVHLSGVPGRWLWVRFVLVGWLAQY